MPIFRGSNVDKTAYHTYHRRFLTAQQRFNEMYRVNPITGCWDWIKPHKGHSYGQFFLNGKQEKSNRAAWKLFRGPIPEGIYVLHSCDNGMCVNYLEHLFLGTALDNMQDKVRKGRHRAPKGEQMPTHKLTTEQVREIRSSPSKGVDLARRYGVGKMTISRIRRGERWRHVI